MVLSFEIFFKLQNFKAVIFPVFGFNNDNFYLKEKLANLQKFIFIQIESMDSNPTVQEFPWSACFSDFLHIIGEPFYSSILVREDRYGTIYETTVIQKFKLL